MPSGSDSSMTILLKRLTVDELEAVSEELAAMLAGVTEETDDSGAVLDVVGMTLTDDWLSALDELDAILGALDEMAALLGGAVTDEFTMASKLLELVAVGLPSQAVIVRIATTDKGYFSNL